MIHPPTHIYYFDKRNISRLLKKYGFEIEHIHYHNTYRNVGSMANQIIMNRKALGKSTFVLVKIYS
jgi:hypothetical protein